MRYPTGHSILFQEARRDDAAPTYMYDPQIRNLVLNTQKTYFQQVSSFARHFQRPTEVLGPTRLAPESSI
ncbi:MAG: hypothetical protein RXR20_24250 [Paraburkholderia sp.]|uniref:hypothetical protein n=1 Tax=Paraburkholderia sp. TaxID=1926495 RepID=UPI00397E1AB0